MTLHKTIDWYPFYYHKTLLVVGWYYFSDPTDCPSTIWCLGDNSYSTAMTFLQFSNIFVCSILSYCCWGMACHNSVFCPNHICPSFLVSTFWSFCSERWCQTTSLYEYRPLYPAVYVNLCTWITPLAAEYPYGCPSVHILVPSF